jgi:hypothetical protein
VAQGGSAEGRGARAGTRRRRIRKNGASPEATEAAAKAPASSCELVRYDDESAFECTCRIGTSVS